MPGKKYDHLLECKGESIADEKGWHWIKGDMNAWDGPGKNWEQSHQTKYFKHVKKYEVVVTAGANHGIHTRFYAKLFDVVYAFEPNPVVFHCMVLNTPYDNVVKMNCALGAKVEMVAVTGHTEKTSGLCKVKPGGHVPCLTIDSLNLSACDLIQLDVEGFEGRVLQGAVMTIDKFRPVVIAENGKRGAVQDLLLKMNYEYKEQSISDTIWAPK